MAKEGKDKYLDALTQAEAGKVVRDHLKHSDFDDQLMDILRKRSDFPVLTRRSLFSNALFWIVIISINLATALIVVKFPELAEWLLSFCKTSS